MKVTLHRCDQETLTDGICMDHDELVKFYHGKIFKIGVLESKIEYDDIDEPIKTIEHHPFRHKVDLNSQIF